MLKSRENNRTSLLFSVSTRAYTGPLCLSPSSQCPVTSKHMQDVMSFHLKIFRWVSLKYENFKKYNHSIIITSKKLIIITINIITYPVKCLPNLFELGLKWGPYLIIFHVIKSLLIFRFFFHLSLFLWPEVLWEEKPGRSSWRVFYNLDLLIASSMSFNVLVCPLRIL